MGPDDDDGLEGGPSHGASHEFCIRGLHCTDCADAVRAGLEGRRGVASAEVSMGSGKACVVYEPSLITPEVIEAEVRRMGYSVERGRATDGPDEGVMGSGEFWATLLAGILLAIGVAMEVLHPITIRLDVAGLHVRGFHLIYLASMVAGGAYVLRRALMALLRYSFVADGLMLVAAAGATAIGDMAEGAAVLFLFSLAELLEDMAAERNRRSLRALVELAPGNVRLRRGGSDVEVDVEEVGVGDLAIVRPGERVPVDGVVVDGASSINEATITGESAPVPKEEGSEVFAGTLNLEGVLEVRVTTKAHDTTLARIIALVEEAEERRAPVERFVDRFARWYTPGVVLGALLVAAVPPLVLGADLDTWVYRALMLLVISCPCALAISVPVAVVSAVTSAARQGVLFKGGAFIEQLAKVDVVAFDKTGTLTTGRPRLVEVVPSKDRTREEVLSLAAGLEAGSEHHLANAVLDAAGELGVMPTAVDGFQAVPGKGVTGRRETGGGALTLGSPGWARELGLRMDEGALSELGARGGTVVMLAEDDEVVGLLAFADTVRTRAREAVASVDVRTMLLSGDSRAASKAVASEVGIDEVYAPLLPQEKLDAIRLLKANGRSVAMVGDGVNDAPSLAEADVGIAMGAVGSGVALETADVVLMREDLTLVPSSISLARRAMAIIRQNVGLAIAIKLSLAVLVFMGLSTLWMAVAIGDMGASLLVILNALRLGRASDRPRPDGHPDRRRPTASRDVPVPT